MASNRKGVGSGSSIVIRPVVATRFLDIDVLEVLGLGDLTKAMLLKAGFGDLWKIKEYTHAGLSCEFIRTLRVKEDKNGRFISITFQAMGQEWTMPIQQVREAVGMTDTPYHEYGLRNKHVQDWWCSITEGRPKVDFRHESGEKLSHPPLRFIHKVIAMAICNSHRIHWIPLSQMYLLYAFSHSRPNLRPDWASDLVDACIRCQAHPSRTIACGGMITRICRAAGVDVDSLILPTSVDPPIDRDHITYDMAYMTDHDILWKMGGGYWQYSFGTTARFETTFPIAGPVVYDKYHPLFFEPDDPEFAFEVEDDAEDAASDGPWIMFPDQPRDEPVQDPTTGRWEYVPTRSSPPHSPQ